MTSSSADPHTEGEWRDEDERERNARLRLAFPAPERGPSKPPEPAFPAPPRGPVTPATRAFPPPLDPRIVAFGESVLRDARAGSVPSARFDVDLRRREPLPPALLAQVRAEAEAAGYAAGWAQGRREAELGARAETERVATETAEITAAHGHRVRRALEALATATATLERLSAPAAHEVEDQIVTTAFELAAAVLDRELRTATEPGHDALARALALAPESSPVTVRLNPADRLTIGVSELLINGRMIFLVDDSTLRPGDAMAQCDATTIDARLIPALERVRKVLGL